MNVGCEIKEISVVTGVYARLQKNKTEIDEDLFFVKVHRNAGTMLGQHCANDGWNTSIHIMSLHNLRMVDVRKKTFFEALICRVLYIFHFPSKPWLTR